MDANWNESIGRRDARTDRVMATPIAATLDRDAPHPADGDPLPPLWHWLFFLPLDRQSDVGRDGHARRGGFLPPIPLPEATGALA